MVLRWMYLFKLWIYLGIYGGVWALDNMVALFLVYCWTSIPFSIVILQFTFPLRVQGNFPFLHTLFIIFVCRFLIMVILASMKWWLIIGSTCISLKLGDVKHLFMCFLTFICILWWNVYLDLLPIFNWVLCVCLFLIELYELFLYFGD